MIRITVELLSARGEKYNRTLARINVTNTGSGTETRGNYEVMAWVGKRTTPYLATVRDYPRKALPALNLITRALVALGYNR